MTRTLRSVSPFVITLGLLALSACTITVTPTDPFAGRTVVDVSVSAEFTDPPVRSDVSLASGEAIIYRVSISDAVAAANDLVYVDALTTSGAVRVTLIEPSGNSLDEVYASSDPVWFGLADDPGITSAAIRPGTQRCGGPCVVVETPDSAGVAYFEVRALSSATFDLYVTATEAFDEGEPNDSRGSAVIVDRDQDGFYSDTGAVETVGDEDWYAAGADVDQVFFFAFNDALGLRADVYDETGAYLATLANEESYSLPLNLPTQRLEARVYSSLERAAGSGDATYTIEFR